MKEKRKMEKEELNGKKMTYGISRVLKMGLILMLEKPPLPPIALDTGHTTRNTKQ